MEQLIVNLSGRINLWTYLSMASWLVMNTCLANVNKWLFLSFSFPYPLFITALHMLCTAVFGFIVIRFTPIGAAYGDGNDRLKLPPQLRPKILILSVISAVSIACGNLALKHLYISFVKMILAMTPLATVLISRLLLGREYDQFTYLSMVPLCFGAVLCTIGEVNFSIFGFVAAFTATMLRAGKCVLQGETKHLKVTQKKEPRRLKRGEEFKKKSVIHICCKLKFFNLCNNPFPKGILIYPLH